jgi:aryl-alcohol dehydrogenase-like predicted oxidoreductase
VEYGKLGSTGLEISRLALGCMSFGDPRLGSHPWSLDEDAAAPIITQALEAGINFFDTANVYSDGDSERILGRVLARCAKREDVVVATKVYSRMRPGPNGAGLSRKAILAEVDASLRRLDMDYIDVYQIHRFDPSTPVEETLEALHDVVKSGKVRYLGASSMYGWEFAKLLHTSERHGWTRMVAMQNHYNLLYREEEREMLPLCDDEGVGVIPWGPLGRGLLARESDEPTHRSRTAATSPLGETPISDAQRQLVAAVHTIAAERGLRNAQVALAWLLSKPVISAPIIGVTKPAQLEEALASVNVTLSPDEIAQLEAPYQPLAIFGH